MSALVLTPSLGGCTMSITTRPLDRPISLLSFLLGNFAAIWGFVIAPIYIVGFFLILRSGATMTLPLVLPMIGLGLAAFGLLLRGGLGDPDRIATAPCAWGLVLNGVPTALALALPLLGR